MATAWLDRLSEMLISGAWLELFVLLFVKSTLILLVAAAVSFALKRASAADRHLVWSVALATTLALPLVAVLVPRWGVPVLPQAPAPVEDLAFSEQAPATDSDITPSTPVSDGAGPAGESLEERSSESGSLAERAEGVQVGDPDAREREAEQQPRSGEAVPTESTRGRGAASGPQSRSVEATPTEDAAAPTAPIDGDAAAEAGSASLRSAGLPWTGLVAGAWVLGILAIACWLVAGRWGVRRMVHRAAVVTDADWLQLTQSLSADLGLRRAVAVLRSERSLTPLASGLVWPAVLLPASADAWPAERRRAVLLHELAHVRRNDCLTQLVAQLACALFWFHPGVWYAARQLRVERERACDDAVLHAGVRASDYASYLLELARTFRSVGFAAPATVSMARPSQLEGRLLAVLDGARQRGAPSHRIRLAAALVSLVIVAPLAAMQPDARTARADDPEAPEAATAGMISEDPEADTGPTAEGRTQARNGEARRGADDFYWDGHIPPGQQIEVEG